MFRKADFEIATVEENRVKVSGFVTELFGICHASKLPDADPGNKFWRVTHLSSGRAVDSLRSLRSAKLFVLALTTGLETEWKNEVDTYSIPLNVKTRLRVLRNFDTQLSMFRKGRLNADCDFTNLMKSIGDV